MTNATATAPIRYANSLIGELDVQGYTAGISRLEQAEKYGPWTLHLTVYSRRDKNTACVFDMDIDPTDGEGLSADIPRLDVDFADNQVPHRRERRMQMREQLARALSDSESGDDFYDYGYNYLLVSDAMVMVMQGLAVTC